MLNVNGPFRFFFSFNLFHPFVRLELIMFLKILKNPNFDRINKRLKFSFFNSQLLILRNYSNFHSPNFNIQFNDPSKLKESIKLFNLI